MLNRIWTPDTLDAEPGLLRPCRLNASDAIQRQPSVQKASDHLDAVGKHVGGDDGNVSISLLVYNTIRTGLPTPGPPNLNAVLLKQLLDLASTLYFAP